MVRDRRPQRAEAGDVARIVDILADAFTADPFFRWMFGPDEDRVRRGIRAWLGLVVGAALPRGEGWIAGDAGAAVWLPPGTDLIGPGELGAAVALLEELSGDRAGDVLGAIASTAPATPDLPHWACL